MPLPKSRNKVYHLEEDEKELLDDSWEENFSDDEDDYVMSERRRSQKAFKKKQEQQTMNKNRMKFFHALKEHRDSEVESKKEEYDQYPPRNEDLDDWTHSMNQEELMFRQKPFENRSEPQAPPPLQRPETSGGDRGKTAGGLRFRTLDEETIEKKRDLDSIRRDLKSPHVTYITSQDLRTSNTKEDPDLTRSLLVQNEELKRQNESLQRALEEERSKYRFKELQEEREKYMRERERSARVIQRGWVSNSLKRSEKRRIKNLEKYGFSLVKKTWTSIPQESGGYCPSKVMVFENSSTSTVTVLAEDVRTNLTKNLELKTDEDQYMDNENVEQNLFINKEGLLEIKNIDVQEVSLSHQNTEKPLIDIDNEKSFDQNESPLFTTEKSVSRDQLINEDDEEDSLQSEEPFIEEDQEVIIEESKSIKNANDNYQEQSEPKEEGALEQDQFELYEDPLSSNHEIEEMKEKSSSDISISEDEINLEPEEELNEIIQETEEEIQAKKAEEEALAKKRNQAAQLIQDYHKYGSQARQRAKEQTFKRVVPLREDKFMVTVKDDKETEKGKVVQCYGVTRWKNYPSIQVSPYLVDKICQNSDKQQPNEAIFDQVELTWDEMKLKNQTPESEPIEVDQFDDIDTVDDLSIPVEDENPDGLDLGEEEEEEEPIINAEIEELRKHEQSREEEDDLLVDEGSGFDPEVQSDIEVHQKAEEEPLIENSTHKEEEDEAQETRKKGSFFSDGMQGNSDDYLREGTNTSENNLDGILKIEGEKMDFREAMSSDNEPKKRAEQDLPGIVVFKRKKLISFQMLFLIDCRNL